MGCFFITGDCDALIGRTGGNTSISPHRQLWHHYPFLVPEFQYEINLVDSLFNPAADRSWSEWKNPSVLQKVEIRACNYNTQHSVGVAFSGNLVCIFPCFHSLASEVLLLSNQDHVSWPKYISVQASSKVSCHGNKYVALTVQLYGGQHGPDNLSLLLEMNTDERACKSYFFLFMTNFFLFLYCLYCLTHLPLRAAQRFVPLIPGSLS